MKNNTDSTAIAIALVKETIQNAKQLAAKKGIDVARITFYPRKGQIRGGQFLVILDCGATGMSSNVGCAIARAADAAS